MSNQNPLTVGSQWPLSTSQGVGLESHTAPTLPRSGREVVGSIPTWGAIPFSVLSDMMTIFQVK